MTIFIGNCQSEFVMDNCIHSDKKKFYRLYFPEISETGSINETLSWVKQNTDEKHFKKLQAYGVLGIQPTIHDLKKHSPEYIVTSYFHPSIALTHKKYGFILSHFQHDYVNCDLKSIFKLDEFKSTDFNGHTYIDGYYNFISKIRQLIPYTKIILFTRIPYYNYFGSRIKSQFNSWPSIQHRIPTLTRLLESELGVKVIDTSRVAGKYFKRTKRIIDFAPNLKLLPEDCPYAARYSLHFDLEHLGNNVYKDISIHIDKIILDGNTTYSKDECIPKEWTDNELPPNPRSVKTFPRQQFSACSRRQISQCFDSRYPHDHVAGLAHLILRRNKKDWDFFEKRLPHLQTSPESLHYLTTYSLLMDKQPPENNCIHKTETDEYAEQPMHYTSPFSKNSSILIYGTGYAAMTVLDMMTSFNHDNMITAFVIGHDGKPMTSSSIPSISLESAISLRATDIIIASHAFDSISRTIKPFTNNNIVTHRWDDIIRKYHLLQGRIQIC